MRKWIFSLLLLMLPLAGCSEGKEGEGPAAASPQDTLMKPGSSLSSSAAGSVTPSSPQTASPGASPPAVSSPTAKRPSGGVLKPDQARHLIEARSAQVISAIQKKDMSRLKDFVHPDKGVRFSPYCFVDVKKDLSFKPDQLKQLLDDKTSRSWGHYDGSGEVIALTFAQYYDQFVNNHDYANAEKIGYNEMLGHGNMVNNIRDIYPDSIIAEYYFSGFDPKVEGHDWASLNLVFEQKGNAWYLVGIVGNRWTI